MSWLSRFSLAQRALIGLMSIIALVFGAIAIPQLKQQLLPTIELPMVSVIAPYQGASFKWEIPIVLHSDLILARALVSGRPAHQGAVGS